MTSEVQLTIKEKWNRQLQNKKYKYLLISGIVILLIILSLLPGFFQYIESRKGININDWILNLIPARDVSIPIFILIWSCAALIIVTAAKDPKLFIRLLYAYITFSLVRNFCVFLVPLNTPPGLIVLKDPLANSFYGATFITKDLFFSGHTSTLFLMALCHTNKSKKVYSICAALIVGILVLVQHVHYTIDVLFAFPFTYICYYVSRWLLSFWISF